MIESVNARRTRRSPSAVLDLYKNFGNAVRTGMTAKEAANCCGVRSMSWAYKALTNLGLRAMLVNDEERALILAHRCRETLR